jgi:hypothetical protein
VYWVARCINSDTNKLIISQFKYIKIQKRILICMLQVFTMKIYCS